MSWFGNIFKKILNNEGIGQTPVKNENIYKIDLDVMTKKQLEEHGRTLGRIRP